MAKVVCIWELGGSLGHISRFARIGEALAEQKHDLAFILSDLTHAEATLSHLNAPIYQAPVWHTPVHDAPTPPTSFPEILMHFGFVNPQGLTGLFKAWKALLQNLKPDLILVDYSPAALIVARSMGIKTSLISSGFCLPPDQTPMPRLLSWIKVTPERLRKNETRVLATINKAAEKAGLNKLNRLYDIFDVNQRFLCTYPELDHYGARQGEPYWGLVDASSGHYVVPSRIKGKSEKPHVFAYLKRGHDRMVIDLLRKLELPATIFAPSMPERYHSRFESDLLRLYKSPLELDEMLVQADLTICHAGHGTIVRSLLAGNPLLLLPLHAEQRALSLRVENMGAGVLPKHSKKPDEIEAALKRLLENESYRERAKEFAIKYAEQQDSAEKVAHRCTELFMRPSY